MSILRVSNAAVGDLEEIGRYSRETWGDDQARRYLLQLDDCFQMLADRPNLGHPYDRDRRPGLLQFLKNRHIVYYRRSEDTGILIVRVLHVSMEPQLHFTGQD